MRPQGNAGLNKDQGPYEANHDDLGSVELVPHLFRQKQQSKEQ